MILLIIQRFWMSHSSCNYLYSHRSMCVCVLETLLKLSMEEIVKFLQVTLSKDFFLEDDFVIEQLQQSMSELRRSKLELPLPGTLNTHMHWNHKMRDTSFCTHCLLVISLWLCSDLMHKHTHTHTHSLLLCAVCLICVLSLSLQT